MNWNSSKLLCMEKESIPDRIKKKLRTGCVLRLVFFKLYVICICTIYLSSVEINDSFVCAFKYLITIYKLWIFVLIRSCFLWERENIHLD